MERTSLVELPAAQRIEKLASSRIFGSIPRSELEVLGEMMRTEAFRAGSVVAEAGEPADCVFVIVDGTLSVYLPGATTPMRTLGPGDVLGEYGMVTGAVRSATVKADVDATLLSLDYERFKAYLLRFPEALFVLFESAAKRLVEAERRH